MSDNWNVYLTSIDENTAASILLDMGIAAEGPDATRPWLLRIALILKDPQENGMITRDEHITISPIEEAIIDAIISACDAVHVGTMTFSGRRDNSFYAATSEGFDQAVQSLTEAFPDYSIRSDATENADWSYYFGLLYPNPYEKQSMDNRSVLYNLHESGDSLEKERLVSHWAYFPNPQSRAQFIAAVQEQGYTIEQESEAEEENAPNPFGVQIDRVDHVDQASIDQITIELYDLAQSLEGNYDGWETFVVRSD